MTWLAWIILGGLAGWIASMLTSNNAGMGLIANIVVGILGAFAGNYLINLFTGSNSTNISFSFQTLLIAIGGAVVLLFLFNLIFGRRQRPKS